MFWDSSRISVVFGCLKIRRVKRNGNVDVHIERRGRERGHSTGTVLPDWKPAKKLRTSEKHKIRIVSKEKNGMFKNLPVIPHHGQALPAPHWLPFCFSNVLHSCHPKGKVHCAPDDPMKSFQQMRGSEVRQRRPSPTQGDKGRRARGHSQAGRGLHGLGSPPPPPPAARHSQASEQIRFHLSVLGRGQAAGPFSQDLPDQVFI